jgi:hypothetical protein
MGDFAERQQLFSLAAWASWSHDGQRACTASGFRGIIIVRCLLP